MMDLLEALLDSPMALLNTVITIGIFIHGVCTINQMSKQTPFIHVISFAFLTVGAFAVFLGTVYGKMSNEPPEVLMNLGVLIICLCDTYLPMKRA